MRDFAGNSSELTDNLRYFTSAGTAAFSLEFSGYGTKDYSRSACWFTVEPRSSDYDFLTATSAIGQPRIRVGERASFVLTSVGGDRYLANHDLRMHGH